MKGQVTNMLKYRYLSFLISLLFIIVNIPSHTNATEDKQVKAKIIEYGIYKSIDKLYNSAEYLTGAVKLVETTDKIPCKLGIQFGIRYSLNKYPLKIVTIWRHPVLEDGSRETRFESEDEGNIIYSGWKLDKGELKCGKWKIEIWHGDTILCEKEFFLYKKKKKDKKAKTKKTYKKGISTIKLHPLKIK